jgi:hypothetical protein
MNADLALDVPRVTPTCGAVTLLARIDRTMPPDIIIGSFVARSREDGR